jgi:predicted nucleotide-binding protein
MNNSNYAGYWTGEIAGTNRGGFTLDAKQDQTKVIGVAKIHEPSLGQYEYHAEGKIVEKQLTLHLTPGRSNNPSMQLGYVQAICSLNEAGEIIGRWKSEIGTEGTLVATRHNAPKETPLPKVNSVFIVHGHDEAAKHEVARFLTQLDIEPVILQEQINVGMTVIEKFETVSERAGYAVVLMTPDDFGYQNGKPEAGQHRARQNVVLELGYFIAKLGRSKTIVLTKGNTEIPSDLGGIVRETMDQGEGWKLRLARELKGAGFTIDMNKV